MTIVSHVIVIHLFKVIHVFVNVYLILTFYFNGEGTTLFANDYFCKKVKHCFIFFRFFNGHAILPVTTI